MTATGDARGEHPFLLWTAPPTRTQVRTAAGVLALLAAALLITAPFARDPLDETEVLLPAYAAAVLVIELTTSALLLASFTIQRCNSLLVLAIGYLFSGLMIVPWALTFPSVFSVFDLSAGLQATASIAALRRLGFPLFVLAYAILKDPPPPRPGGSPAWPILAGVGLAAAFVAGFAWFVMTHEELLPRLMRDDRNITALWQYVPPLAIFFYLSAFAVLWLRRRSVLDLWLMVVLCTLLIELLLLSYFGGGVRLSVGWWAGRLFGLASACMVLFMLLAGTTRLYVRLARSVSAERRARENRLTAMEALSASIAHEVNQPLGSMVTNAYAGLRWLSKEQPALPEARAALQRIVKDGHRADDVIKSIRLMFKKGPHEREPLDLNQEIEEVAQRSRSELQLGRITLQLVLAEDLPQVSGNALQLQQVLSNLVANAIDAMAAAGGRPRLLRIETERRDGGAVLVTVADSGSGIPAELRERIFEPFFTTKKDGMGMGLMFCRTIVEANGGRLWVGASSPEGTTLHFTLPVGQPVEDGSQP